MIFQGIKEREDINISFSNAKVDVPRRYKHRISYQEILKSMKEFSHKI